MSGIILNVVGGTYITPIPAIGASYGGGYFAGQFSTAGTGIADYNLVIGPKATALSTSVRFKTSNTGGDPTDQINGPANSAAMNDASHPAAQFCEGLTIGGFSDWYMPAQNELITLYYFLKPSTDNNSTTYGANASAVSPQPISTNFTISNPAVTTATDFLRYGSEALEFYDYYWSSTQSPTYSNSAYAIKPAQGNSIFAYKNQSGVSVRAIRRVAV